VYLPTFPMLSSQLDFVLPKQPTLQP